MALADDLARIADAVRVHGGLVAVLAAEPAPEQRAYLCAFADGSGDARRWLVVDDAGAPVAERQRVRDAVTVAALCEVAEESAFAGDLDDLRAQLVALRIAERPPGIEAAEDAALALQTVLAAPPQVASLERLDAIGQATRRLEQALDATAGSPFGAAMQAAQGAVEQVLRDVEAGYLVELQ
jgi:hypothetical protein